MIERASRTGGPRLLKGPTLINVDDMPYDKQNYILAWMKETGQ
jgi:hypothetical protein